MDYSRPDLVDRLAADYAAGTLRGAARRRFESLLPAHPGLRAAAQAWQERLMPLTATIAPEPPPASLWQRIEARLHGNVHGAASTTAPANTSWWSQLGFWRALSAVGGALALSLAVMLGSPGPAQAPIIVVLSAAAPVGGGATPASFVASISGDGRAMVTRPLTNVSVEANHSLELWSVPASGAPRSLGVISASSATVVQKKRVLDGAAALAVTLEPPGGSPTGGPTGPVLYSGKLTL